jgi:hypothetical protein
MRNLLTRNVRSECRQQLGHAFAHRMFARHRAPSIETRGDAWDRNQFAEQGRQGHGKTHGGARGSELASGGATVKRVPPDLDGAFCVDAHTVPMAKSALQGLKCVAAGG